MEDIEKITKIATDLQWCRDNINRLLSNAESERDVRRDVHIEINKKIDKVENDLRGTLFGNGKLGLIIEIDRLKQFKKAFYAVSGIVVGIVIKMIIDFIVGK